MDTTISYINDRGEYKISIVPTDLQGSGVSFDEAEGTYAYIHPITKRTHLLHSLADRPCLWEDPDRIHWMWKGKLHRLTGPAFTCNLASEWYAFGWALTEGDHARFKEYLLKVEAFALANKIDLHGIHDGVGVNKHFLNFTGEDHLLECAENNIIPICNRETGDEVTCSIDELVVEMSKPTRGSGLIMAAILGAAAAYAVNKLKPDLLSKKTEGGLARHEVVSEEYHSL